MKCLVCPNTIDELRTFEGVVGPNGQVIEDLVGRIKHARELETWTHASVIAQSGGGSQTVLSGHVCPNHQVSDLELSVKTSVADKGKKS